MKARKIRPLTKKLRVSKKGSTTKVASGKRKKILRDLPSKACKKS
jgi:hypothetical protein